MAASYLFLTLAPMAATVAAVRRGLRDGLQPARGWSVAALALLFWCVGMAASARQDLLLGNTSTAPGDSMFLYVLYGVPLTWAISAVHVGRSTVGLRLIDGVTAASLGALYFVYTLSLARQHQTAWLVWTFDVENLFLFAGFLMRWRASTGDSERSFFGTLAVFLAAYAAVAGYNNHVSAYSLNLEVGTLVDLVVPVPFLLFAIISARPATAAARSPSASLVRYVRSASPLLLSMALLIVSMVIVRTEYVIGVVGVAIAVLGYGLRSVLGEVRHIETEIALRDDRSAFQTLASTDALTGLANRRAFDEALATERRRSARAGIPLGLLMIDVDHFKRLNDHYGHPAGDECLRRIAGSIRKSLLRPSDVAYRYGGEEFVVLLPDTSASGLQQVGERVRADVESLRLPHVESPFGQVTISIGATWLPPESPCAADVLLASADAALYDAKRDGRNRVAMRQAPAA